MTRHSLKILAFLVIGFHPVLFSSVTDPQKKSKDVSNLLICCFKNNNTLVVVDKFYGIINVKSKTFQELITLNDTSVNSTLNGIKSTNKMLQNCNSNKNQGSDIIGAPCMIFLQQNSTMEFGFESTIKPFRDWAEVNLIDGVVTLKVLKTSAKKDVFIHAFSGNCSADASSCKCHTVNISNSCKSSTFNEEGCPKSGSNDRYKINMTSGVCVNCDNPVKKPEETVIVNVTLPAGKTVSSAAATKIMSQMTDLVANMNGTSASLSIGEGVKGVIVKQADPMEMNEISLAYDTPSQDLNIIDDKAKLMGYSRFVTVSKEAFDKAKGLNNTSPFAAVLKFLNMSQDENITILGNEVLAVEMGVSIQNLTDTINITLKSNFEGIPVCNSWSGEGDLNWTTDGCDTIVSGNSITCQCTHLTFFAILMTPLNETISTYNLNTLTTLTRVGCGLSMFFLCVVLFMHFLIRNTKPNISTLLFIHLVTALLLLNFTFLINDLVANMNGPSGCVAMAFFMHYFMLVTFTWFGVHAIHLCLQMYIGSNITINRYVLKVSVSSWTIPSIFGIVFLITKKYGELSIYTSDSEKISKMCWITDNSAHLIVNVGYYIVVFLLTFSTVITSMYWLCRFKQSKTQNPDRNEIGKQILFTLGLCSQLGVTWGFAFFAYGAFRIPAYYIFTVLNSLQGFFLFIYYNNSGHVGNIKDKNKKTTANSTNVSCLKSSSESSDNPYKNH